jgi:2-deoxystreptamine N-acetyl-D-glucosaminyltransferase/2-deoxystreptamine glucosyltransferase
VPRQKIVVIPNAVNVQTFRGTGVPPVKNHGRDGHATVFNVGFVGRLDPVKRVGDLIAAIASLPPTIHLAIYGDGAMRPQIEHAITLTPGLDGRVVLHGMIANPREAYEKIDVLVLPSVAEGFGLVLIEAMAAGVPVIGTNVDGIRDVIEHEQTGLLVPPRDPRALAAAITLLREDAALRERLVQTARTEVQRRFAWPAVLRSYRELLDQREPLPRQDGQDQSL